MTEFTTRDGTQIFSKEWSADQLIGFSHGSPVLFPTSPDARGPFIRYKRGD